MKRRLYFLLPNVSSAQQIVNELLLSRVNYRHIHLMAKEGVSLAGLPEANLLQKSDVIHGTELGLTVGGLVGACAGLAGVYILNLAPLGLVLLGTALAGAVIGAWASSMIAVNVPNTRLKEFAHDLETDHVLLMVDVPKERVDEITVMIRGHHPEADSHGIEPTIPAFP